MIWTFEILYVIEEMTSLRQSDRHMRDFLHMSFLCSYPNSLATSLVNSSFMCYIKATNPSSWYLFLTSVSFLNIHIHVFQWQKFVLFGLSKRRINQNLHFFTLIDPELYLNQLKFAHLWKNLPSTNSNYASLFPVALTPRSITFSILMYLLFTCLDTQLLILFINQTFIGLFIKYSYIVLMFLALTFIFKVQVIIISIIIFIFNLVFHILINVIEN